jgi:hypothetical protein
MPVLPNLNIANLLSNMNRLMPNNATNNTQLRSVA